MLCLCVRIPNICKAFHIFKESSYILHSVTLGWMRLILAHGIDEEDINAEI
jgi:hypothetical protein